MIARIKNWLYRLLRRGEHYTGTDNVYLAKGGLLFSVGQFVASLSSLGLAMLFARFVSKDVYGTYQYLLSWGSIIALSSLTGMSDALTRAVAQGHDRSLFTVLRARLRWSLLGTAIAVSVGGYYLAHGRGDLFAGFLLIGIFFPLQTSLSAWADYAIGKKRFDLQTRYGVLLSLGAAATIAAVILLAPRVMTLVLAFCLAFTAGQALCLRATLKRLPPAGDAAPDTTEYGKKLTIIDIISSLSTYLDRIIIFTFLGARETAIYAFAIAPPEQIKGYLKNLYPLALPKVASRPLAEIRKNFYKKFFLLLGVISAGIVAYIAIAPLFYRWLFPAYQEAVPLSRLFAVSLVAVAVVLPQSVFNGHKRLKENSRFQIATAIVTIGALALFTWKWGLIGTVAARIFGRLFGLVYAMAELRGVFKAASPAGPPTASPFIEG